MTFGSEAADRLATSQSQTKKKQWLACKGSGWYLGDFHHEDMTEDLSEDLPVTKRINVMVGITRSKVFFNDYERRCWSCKSIISYHLVSNSTELRTALEDCPKLDKKL